MLDLVKGYLAAIIESASESGRLDSLASDLTGFSTAVVESNDLRQALSDSAIPATARRAIAAELLSGRASPEAASLVSFIIRTERAPDVSSSLILAVELAEGAASTPPVEEIENSGHSPERVRGYSERIFQELDAAALDQTEEELFSLARLFEAEDVLRHALGDPTLTRGARREIAQSLFGSKVIPATLRLLCYLITEGRSRDLVGAVQRIAELIAEERGRRIAEVRAAVDLDDAERRRLAGALGLLVDRTVEVRVVIDPTVVGGMFVTVGDLVIDGTVRLRFERLRDALALASI